MLTLQSPACGACHQLRPADVPMRMQASASSSEQLPMPLPPPTASLTSIHLRPQLDQYEDMARFLGYSSSSASPSASQQDRSTHSHESSQSGLPAAAASQALPSAHVGLYPNDHAMDLPATTPFRASVPVSGAASVPASVNPWENLNVHQRAASTTSTSSSSSSSRHSHHRSHASPHQASHHSFQPQQPQQLQEPQQPGTQLQTPASRVAPSPFMADAEHSFTPFAFPSPFMADAEHSFVPTPVQDPPQNSWEPFGSPTFPQTDVHSNGHTGSAHTQPQNAVHSGNDATSNALPPTNYFSYLDLLGPGQSGNPQTVSQQQFLLQHQQHRQHQQHSYHGQSRSRHQPDRQQDRQQHRQDSLQQQQQQHRQHQQELQQQHHQHHQELQQQHRRDREQTRHQNHSKRHLHQPHVQQQVGDTPQQHSGQQPTGTSSDPLPVLGVNYHSVFDSFDEPSKNPSGDMAQLAAHLLT